MAFTVATSHAGYSTAATTYAGPVPGTINEGDLIFAQLVSNISGSTAITPPTGWTTLVDDGSGNYLTSGGNGAWWGYHLVTAAEAATPPSSWDFTLSTARTGNIMITRVTGHDTTTPMDTSVSVQTGSFSDTVPLACASLTSTVNDALLIGGCSVQSASSRTITEPTTPGTWTEDDTTCALSLGRGQDASHYVLGTAGATGTVNWYQSGSSLAGIAFMVVVAPSSATNWSATGPMSLTDSLTGSVVLNAQSTGSMPLTDSLAGGAAVERFASGSMPLVASLSGGAIVEHPITGAMDLTVSMTGSGDTALIITGGMNLTVSQAGSVVADLIASGAMDLVSSMTGAGDTSIVITGSMDLAAGLDGLLTNSMSATGAMDLTALLTGGAVAEVLPLYFTPPTHLEPLPTLRGPFYRYHHQVGRSVLKIGGFYYQYDSPNSDLVAASEVAYLGGRSYQITGDEYVSLLAAGYGAYITVGSP